MAQVGGCAGIAALILGGTSLSLYQLRQYPLKTSRWQGEMNDYSVSSNRPMVKWLARG